MTKASFLIPAILLTLTSCANIDDNPTTGLGFQPGKQSQTLIKKNSLQSTCGYYFKADGTSADASIESISLTTKNNRKWHKNLFQALTSKSLNIPDKFKQRFKAEIIVNYANGSTCTFEGTMRFSGDLKDHIEIKDGKIVSSLDIRLKAGNIHGATRFKLLLPRTRNGDNEIFVTELIRQLGIISPRTRYIRAFQNGVPVKMLFQEGLAKELIEYHRQRESALLEVDESLSWDAYNTKTQEQSAFKDKDQRDYQLLFPKLINGDWWKINEVNKEVAWSGMAILARSLSESWRLSKLGIPSQLSDSLLSSGDEQTHKVLARFRLLMVATKAEHALGNNQRRFYFSPLNHGLLPVYYDGSPKLLDKIRDGTRSASFDSSFYKEFIRGVRREDIEQTVKDLLKVDKRKLALYLSMSGVEMSQKDIDIALESIRDNIRSISFIAPSSEETYWMRTPHLNHPSKLEVVFGKDAQNYFTICSAPHLACQRIVLDKFKEFALITGSLFTNGVKQVFAGISAKKYFKGDDPGLLASRYKIDANTLDSETKILLYQNANMVINRKRKKLAITVPDCQSHVVVKGGTLINWKISMHYTGKDCDSHGDLSRNNYNLLTGTLSFIDVTFKNVEISTIGSNMEDAVNIIRGKGSLAKIEVMGSKSDAIDFDFSDMSISQAKVEMAQNDCLDVSGGSYKIDMFQATHCGDKGISIGERSTALLGAIDVNSSRVPIAIKDLSSARVNKATFRTTKECVQIYQKKQEYGGGLGIFGKLDCGGKKMYIQYGSHIRY